MSSHPPGCGPVDPKLLEIVRKEFDRRDQTTPVKHSAGKPRMCLAMGPGFVEMAKAMTFGAKKYSDHNYAAGEGLPRLDLVDAAARHIAAYLEGADTDEESGLHHLAHAGASLLMAVDLIQRGKGKDGRYSRGTP